MAGEPTAHAHDWEWNEFGHGYCKCGAISRPGQRHEATAPVTERLQTPCPCEPCRTMREKPPVQPDSAPRSHWEDCEYVHHGCALVKLADARAEIEAGRERERALREERDFVANRNAKNRDRAEAAEAALGALMNASSLLVSACEAVDGNRISDSIGLGFGPVLDEMEHVVAILSELRARSTATPGETEGAK